MSGIIINQDTDGILSAFVKLNPQFTEEDIKKLAHIYEGSQVSDLFICVLCGTTVFPSKSVTSILDKYHQKIENGKPVDYSSTPYVVALHRIFEELKTDHIQIFIDEYNKMGINPWLSFRMNDFHSRHMDTNYLFPDFYHEHPEVRRVKYHPSYLTNNGDRAYDYSYEIVREHFLSIINESLEHYDPYGIELDFQREIEVFAQGCEYEGLEIMNAFMRDVKALVEKHSEARGHKIKVAVHVTGDIEVNYDFGHDVMQWVRDGAVDMIVLGGRFECTDNDVPVKLWKGLCEPYGVEIAVGADERLRPYYEYPVAGQNFETLNALAVNAFSQGADKIYLFNHFWTDFTTVIDKEAPLIYDASISRGKPQMYWSILNTIGSYDTAIKHNRHHIMTYKDRLPFWYRNMHGKQLPATIERSAGFKFSVGDIPAGSKLTLRVGVADSDDCEANPPSVFVNSVSCQYKGATEDRRWAPVGTLLCYDIPEGAHKHNICPYIIVNDITTIKYMDVLVEVPN